MAVDLEGLPLTCLFYRLYRYKKIATLDATVEEGDPRSGLKNVMND
jgi:hypothetical protein